MRHLRLRAKDLVEMTYVQAFLALTVEDEVPFKVAIDWLHFLAQKYPESRLAVHMRQPCPWRMDKVG